MLNRINTTELPPQRWSCPDHSRRKKHVAAIQIKRLSLSEGIEPFNGHAFDAKSPASNGLEACPATVAFYEDPDQQVEPSAQVVVAVDAWARELARNSLTSPTPTLFCTPDGQCTPAVELRLSRDLVSDPSGHPCDEQPAGDDDIPTTDIDALRDARAEATLCPVCQQNSHIHDYSLRPDRYQDGRRTLAHLYTVPVQYAFDGIRNCPHCRENPGARTCRASRFSRPTGRL